MPEGSPQTESRAAKRLALDRERDRRRQIATRAREFLLHMDALARQLRTHDAANATPQATLRELVKDIRDLQDEEGDLALVFAEGHAFVNGVWLRATRRHYQAARHLFEVMTSLDGRGVVLEDGVPSDTLLALGEILRDGGEAPQNKQAIQHLGGIRLLGLPSAADQARTPREQARKDALDVFRDGLVALDRGEIQRLDLFMRRRHRALAQRLIQLAEDSTEDLLALTTIRDPNLPHAAHSMAVCIYSIAIGRRMDLNRRDLLRLGVAALNHNLGEAMLPEDIFRAARKLMAHERSQVDQHPLLGLGHILQHYGFGAGILDRALVAAEHHMDYDGEGGYPFAGGAEAHLFSRIVAVADVFDALCSPRPYRQAYPPDQAIKLIRRYAGRRLDPVLVRLLVRSVGRYPPGSLVELDTGEWGVVIGPGMGADPLQRPRVLIISDEDGFEAEEFMAVDLGERHPRRRAWLRTIVRTRDPHKLGLNVPAFLFSERIDVVPTVLDLDEQRRG